ncbi:MAG: BrnA antitoxin family protein [Oscillospiraceae bacterium]|nr:BrnA antitoxin family protein [Oscillospiraceae bacterium]
MRSEYNIADLHPRKNPYAKKLKQQVTMNLNVDTFAYFKTLAEQTGIPYQTLINLYLTDCAEQKRQLSLFWN